MSTPTITPGLLAQAREGIRDPLAVAVLDILKRALARSRIPAQDVDDLCQHKVLKILEVLIAGRVEPGNEDAYVWRCGETSAISYFRKKKRPSVEFEEDTTPGEQGQGEEEETQEREARLQRQVEALREVLAGKELSPADVGLLRQVYVAHTSLEQLAREELNRNPTIRKGPQAGAPKTLAQARNSVDQRLTRARQRLSAILQRRLS